MKNSLRIQTNYTLHVITQGTYCIKLHICESESLSQEIKCMLSCRLGQFSDDYQVICANQAGFRNANSTMDKNNHSKIACRSISQ